LAFLKQFLELKNGIPSHDTIKRIFQTLNPQQFERCFISWIQEFKDDGILERVIAIEGKTARGSKDSFHHKSPFHSLHAWSVANGICLGQIASHLQKYVYVKCRWKVNVEKYPFYSPAINVSSI
jgi:hypothetical protein